MSAFIRPRNQLRPPPHAGPTLSARENTNKLVTTSFSLARSVEPPLLPTSSPSMRLLPPVSKVLGSSQLLRPFSRMKPTTSSAFPPPGSTLRLKRKELPITLSRWVMSKLSPTSLPELPPLLTPSSTLSTTCSNRLPIASPPTPNGNPSRLLSSATTRSPVSFLPLPPSQSPPSSPSTPSILQSQPSPSPQLALWPLQLAPLSPPQPCSLSE